MFEPRSVVSESPALDLTLSKAPGSRCLPPCNPLLELNDLQLQNVESSLYLSSQASLNDEYGMSGCRNTDVRPRVGCAQHNKDMGDNDYYCYVVDPGACAISLPSNVYQDAQWKFCNPSIDPPPQSSLNSTVLDVIEGVRKTCKRHVLQLGGEVGSEIS